MKGVYSAGSGRLEEFRPCSNVEILRAALTPRIYQAVVLIQGAKNTCFMIKVDDAAPLI